MAHAVGPRGSRRSPRAQTAPARAPRAGCGRGAPDGWPAPRSRTRAGCRAPDRAGGPASVSATSCTPPARGLLEPAVAPAPQPQPIERLGARIDAGRLRGAAVAGFRAVQRAAALEHAAHRQRFDPVAARRLAAAGQPQRAAGDRGERDQIEAVVLEHRLQRTRIAGPQELEEPSRDLEPVDIADAPQVQQHPLQRRQAAPAVVRISVRPRPPQPPRRMEHVEVRHFVQRRRHAMEGPARFHHRHVEGLAVVGDDQIGLVEQLRGRREQRPLRVEAAQEELPDLERAERRNRRSRRERRRCRRRRSARWFRDR